MTAAILRRSGCLTDRWLNLNSTLFQQRTRVPMRPDKSILNRAALLCLLALSGSGCLFAQSFPFQLVVQRGSTAQNISNGTTVSVSSNGVGQSIQLTLLVTNNGNAPATFSTPQLLGDATDFSVNLSAPTPVVQPGNTTEFTINFTASTTSAVS